MKTFRIYRAICLLFALSAGIGGPQTLHAREQNSLVKAVAAIEQYLGGRVGMSVHDHNSGWRWSHRGHERFPMMSTFKTLACAQLLSAADAQAIPLAKRIQITPTDIVTYSPVTEPRAGKEPMSLGDLCAATLATSDNTAANLILRTLGGPTTLTGFLRSLGDPITRLDRYETALNEATPGDPRDTTTPDAMVATLETLLLGDRLSETSRDRLIRWMAANQVADGLLRAHLPEGWGIADRTGAGGHGSRAITAVIWPVGRKPVVAAIYMTETNASFADRNAAIADIGRLLFATLAAR